MKYTPRLTTPSKDNKYYNSNSNPFVPAGYGMFQNGGNCTCYAWGRFYELLTVRPSLYTGNAETWFPHTEDGYKRGDTPKLGAVACWEGKGSKAGHVAVVEAIDEDGTVTFSNSGWRSSLFYLTKMKAPFNLGSLYKFQGFIYNPNNYEEETPKKPTKSVEEIVKEVINGKWGNGADRAKRLTDAGYNYDEVQKKVNELLSPTKTTTYTVKLGDTLSQIARKYNTTVNNLINANKAKYPVILRTHGNYIQAGWKLTIK